MTDYERFREYGRIRKIAKDADPYALTFEKDKHLYVAISSGQVVGADKFHGMRDSSILGWLRLLLTIGLDKRQKPLSNRTIETI